MKIRKLIKSSIFLISLFFLANCSSNGNDKGITIYEPDCNPLIGKSLDKRCDNDLVKTDLKKKSKKIDKASNKTNKLPKGLNDEDISRAIYAQRAENHCKKYKKIAYLIEIKDRIEIIGERIQPYSEIYRCI